MEHNVKHPVEGTDSEPAHGWTPLYLNSPEELLHLSTTSKCGRRFVIRQMPSPHRIILAPRALRSADRRAAALRVLPSDSGPIGGEGSGDL